MLWTPRSTLQYGADGYHLSITFLHHTEISFGGRCQTLPWNVARDTWQPKADRSVSVTIKIRTKKNEQYMEITKTKFWFIMNLIKIVLKTRKPSVGHNQLKPKKKGKDSYVISLQRLKCSLTQWTQKWKCVILQR